MILRLRSSGKCISELESHIKQLFEHFDLDRELYPNVLISLTEAVNNAVKHGNENDHSKHVVVQTVRLNDCIQFVITDEGPGFDYDNLPDPTSPENLENPGGRGVFLMKQLSDKVKFLDNGSTVEIHFEIS